MNLRVARELLHQYVREVFGGASGNYRQGGERRGIGDEPARVLSHGDELSDR